jgi:hypothetical protein
MKKKEAKREGTEKEAKNLQDCLPTTLSTTVEKA